MARQQPTVTTVNSGGQATKTVSGGIKAHKKGGFASKQMTAADVNAFFASQGIDLRVPTKATRRNAPSKPPVTTPAPRETIQPYDLVTQRQEPQKGTTLTPERAAEVAKTTAARNKQSAERSKQEIARIKAINVGREAEGRTPIRVPEPFAPPQAGVQPDKTIHGIPLRDTQVAVNPQPAVSMAPTQAAPPRDSNLLSSGQPVPGFPWTPGGPVVKTATPLPWRTVEAPTVPPPPTELPPPIQGSIVDPRTSSAVSEQPFVSDVPVTTEQISQAQADKFLHPMVEPKQAAARVQAPGEQPPLSQGIAPSQSQIRPKRKIQQSGVVDNPAPEYPWTKAKAKAAEGPLSFART